MTNLRAQSLSLGLVILATSTSAWAAVGDVPLQGLGMRLLPSSDLAVARPTLASIRAAEKGAATAILNKILDEVQSQMSLSDEVSEARARFAVRMVLLENAAAQKKVPFREVELRDSAGQPLLDSAGLPKRRKIPAPEAAGVSDDELFGYLHSLYRGKRLKFTLDWNYSDGGLRLNSEALKDARNEALPWPTVAIEMKRLPNTLSDFRAAMTKQLSALLPSMNRQAVWRSHSLQNNSLASFRIALANRSDDRTQMYQFMKDRFFSTERSKAVVQEIVLMGPLAPAAQERLEILVQDESARRVQLLAADKSLIPSQSMTEIERQTTEQRGQEKVSELRREVPSAVFEALRQEFSSELSQGTLVLQNRERSFETANQLAAVQVSREGDLMSESEAAQALLSPLLGDGELVPRMSYKNGKEHVTALRMNLEPIGAEVASEDHPSVKALLQDALQSRATAVELHRAVLALFQQHPRYFSTTSCVTGTPCMRTDTVSLAAALFPHLSHQPFEGLTPEETYRVLAPVSMGARSLRDQIRFFYQGDFFEALEGNR